MRSCLFSSVMVLETACVSVRELPLRWVFLWLPSSDTEDLKVGVRREERKRGEKEKSCEIGEQEKERRGEEREEEERRKRKGVRERIRWKEEIWNREKTSHITI